MRKIDDYAERLAPADEGLAEGRQSLGIAPAATERRVAGLVGAEVEKAEVADTTPGEAIELFEIAIERMSSLDPEERGRNAIAGSGLDLAGGEDLADATGMGGHQPVERVDLLLDGGRIASFGKGQRDQAEELRSDASLDQPRKIHVPGEGGPRKGRLMPFGQVVADPSRPHQRIGVQIDGGMFRMNRASFVGAEHGARG